MQDRTPRGSRTASLPRSGADARRTPTRRLRATTSVGAHVSPAVRAAPWRCVGRRQRRGTSAGGARRLAHEHAHEVGQQTPRARIASASGSFPGSSASAGLGDQLFRVDHRRAPGVASPSTEIVEQLERAPERRAIAFGAKWPARTDVHRERARDRQRSLHAWRPALECAQPPLRPRRRPISPRWAPGVISMPHPVVPLERRRQANRREPDSSEQLVRTGTAARIAGEDRDRGPDPAPAPGGPGAPPASVWLACAPPVGLRRCLTIVHHVVVDRAPSCAAAPSDAAARRIGSPCGPPAARNPSTQKAVGIRLPPASNEADHLVDRSGRSRSRAIQAPVDGRHEERAEDARRCGPAEATGSVGERFDGEAITASMPRWRTRPRGDARRTPATPSIMWPPVFTGPWT